MSISRSIVNHVLGQKKAVLSQDAAAATAARGIARRANTEDDDVEARVRERQLLGAGDDPVLERHARLGPRARPWSSIAGVRSTATTRCASSPRAAPRCRHRRELTAPGRLARPERVDDGR